MKTTNNSVKDEVFAKQYLPAFLDISGYELPYTKGPKEGKIMYLLKLTS